VDACVGLMMSAITNRDGNEDIDLRSLFPSSVPKGRPASTPTFSRETLVESLMSTSLRIVELEELRAADISMGGSNSSTQAPPSSSSNTGTSRTPGGRAKAKKEKGNLSEREQRFANRTPRERVCKLAWYRQLCPDKGTDKCVKIHPDLCDKETRCVKDDECSLFHGYKGTLDSDGKPVKREKKKKKKLPTNPSSGNGGGTGSAAGQSPSSWRQELKRRQVWDRQQKIPPWSHKGQQYYQMQQQGHWQQQGPLYGPPQGWQQQGQPRGTGRGGLRQQGQQQQVLPRGRNPTRSNVNGPTRAQQGQGQPRQPRNVGSGANSTKLNPRGSGSASAASKPANRDGSAKNPELERFKRDLAKGLNNLIKSA
jgi:hypothetical protein